MELMLREGNIKTQTTAFCTPLHLGRTDTLRPYSQVFGRSPRAGVKENTLRYTVKLYTVGTSLFDTYLKGVY